MGKILNTTYHDTVENITNFYNDLVNNPFYTFNDKKPVICTYYNINKDYSSLDPGSKIHMSNIGKESPIKFNRVYDMLLYGFSKIELNNDNTEFGLESDKVEGECFILPNTIVPTEGDFFELEHIKDSSYLFMVKDVQKDTLNNGSNVYKISYKLQYTNHDEIFNNIVYNFRLIEKKEGTNIAKVVRCEDYDIAKIMDNKAVLLKEFFKELFYNSKVQTFIYMDLYGYRVYDPYMVEFLIRNKILENDSESYIHVTHQIPTINTFSLEYNKTFFRVFEDCDIDSLMRSNRETSIELIKSYGTTFHARFEEYFKTTYQNNNLSGYHTICFPDDLAIRIVEKKPIILSDEDKQPLWLNIIIKYFLNEDLNEDDVLSIEKMEFNDSKNMFYMIPLLIFCLEKGIEKALK